jgi:hypothetical protein
MGPFYTTRGESWEKARRGMAARVPLALDASPALSSPPELPKPRHSGTRARR